MKPVRLLWLCLALPVAVSAQEYELDTNALKEVMASAEEWVNANLDEDVWSGLEPTARETVEQFVRDLQKGLQSESVMDLVPLKAAAQVALPLLEAHEETQPFALWLKTRLDYLDAAEELRRLVLSPSPVPGEPPKTPTKPTPADGRKIWQQRLADRPWPKGAKDLVPKLKPIFAAERVPPELVWLAEVESGFDRRARSPAGAAGLFQLMPATAKRFGLRTWPRDQRYQPERSARAAAQYLRFLHDKFGNWALVLAAYNAGEGRVQKLLERQPARSFDLIAVRLPAETQLYVPKVEAVVKRREGLELDKLKPRA